MLGDEVLATAAAVAAGLRARGSRDRQRLVWILLAVAAAFVADNWTAGLERVLDTAMTTVALGLAAWMLINSVRASDRHLTADVLLSRADTAMYAAKRSGKSRIVAYRTTATSSSCIESEHWSYRSMPSRTVTACPPSRTRSPTTCSWMTPPRSEA